MEGKEFLPTKTLMGLDWEKIIQGFSSFIKRKEGLCWVERWQWRHFILCLVYFSGCVQGEAHSKGRNGKGLGKNAQHRLRYFNCSWVQKGELREKHDSCQQNALYKYIEHNEILAKRYAVKRYYKKHTSWLMKWKPSLNRSYHFLKWRKKF